MECREILLLIRDFVKHGVAAAELIRSSTGLKKLAIRLHSADEFDWEFATPCVHAFRENPSATCLHLDLYDSRIPHHGRGHGGGTRQVIL